MKSKQEKTPRSGRCKTPVSKAMKNVPPLEPKLRLLIVDDHAVVRGGLEAMLALAPGIDRIATAADGAEAMRVCAAFEPNVVLLDLRMPGMDGHSTLEAIMTRWPGLRVIILTGNETSGDMKLAQRHGAAGFLSKSAEPKTVLSVIHKVAAGSTCFPVSMDHETQDSCGLSGRELEVLRHLVRGLTNGDIGLALGVSGQTIKGHLKNIFAKLDAGSRSEAVSRAHEMKLI
ncbi:response regulator transcription factor [soil metagenome]